MACVSYLVAQKGVRRDDGPCVELALGHADDRRGHAWQEFGGDMADTAVSQ